MINLRRSVAVIAAITLVVGCGGSAVPSASHSSPTATTPSGSSGADPSSSPGLSATPDLTGETVRFAISAPPQALDGHIAVMADILKSWGANVELINQLGQPAAIRVVLSDHGDVANAAATAAINSGLVVFGPLQPRLDWYLVGAPDVDSLDDLKHDGRVHGGANPGGMVELMWDLTEETFNIAEGEIRVRDAGAASARVAALTEGQIDSTFVHVDAWRRLSEQGYPTILVMADEFPELADSYLGASIFWIREHPNLAVAMNLAWLEAAKVFKEDGDRWVALTTAYTEEPEADVRTVYENLAAAQSELWPRARDAFALDSCQFSSDAGVLAGIIENPPPTEEWCIQDYWVQAADLAELP